MANTYVLINSNTLSADTASVSFNSIPQTYTDLIVKISDRTDSISGTIWYAYMKFNGSSSSVYASNYIFNSGSTNSAGKDAATTGYLWDDPYTTLGSTSTADTFTNNELYIPNYTTANYKPFSYDYGLAITNATSARGASAGLFISTDAITSITFYNYSTGKFASGSTWHLYGIKNS